MITGRIKQVTILGGTRRNPFTSALHINCRHLNSSILFLRLQTFKWATLRSFLERASSCRARFNKWDPHCLHSSSSSEVSPWLLPCKSYSESDSSDTAAKGSDESVSTSRLWSSSNWCKQAGHFQGEMLSLEISTNCLGVTVWGKCMLPFKRCWHSTDNLHFQSSKLINNC